MVSNNRMNIMHGTYYNIKRQCYRWRQCGQECCWWWWLYHNSRLL